MMHPRRAAIRAGIARLRESARGMAVACLESVVEAMFGYERREP